MLVTIATHNGGGQANREHNIRNPKVTKQGNGPVEIWQDIKVRDAYKILFQSSVDAYNSKQTRADRRIDNYYNTVRKDAKKHPCYEMIVGVYMQDRGQVDYELQRKILAEFTLGWNKRNPNLQLIGAYLHADEEGQTHVHLDYIPIAHGYKRGPETQTGLVKALGEMGFFHKSGRATAQIQWEARENKVLEDLCIAHGMRVLHPREEGRKHIATQDYKAKMALQDKQEQLDAYEKHIGDLPKTVEQSRPWLERKLGLDAVTVPKELLQQMQGAVDYVEQHRTTMEQLAQAQKRLDLAEREVELAKQDAQHMRSMADLERQQVAEKSNKLDNALEHTNSFIYWCAKDLIKKLPEPVQNVRTWLQSNYPQILEQFQQFQEREFNRQLREQERQRRSLRDYLEEEEEDWDFDL